MSNRESPSRQVLEEAPLRALKFLQGVSTFAPIAILLASKGYSQEDHLEGWNLLHVVTGYKKPPPPMLEVVEVRDAIAELDAWDEPNFRIIHAALQRRHPDQDELVFRDLTPTTGAGAVLTVKTLLDRLDTLEKGKDRKETRTADHAALATLEKRGITPAERKRVRGLIAIAQRGLSPEALLSDAPLQVAALENQSPKREDLEKLRAWLVEWSETARAVIKRRDYLIRLGLAKRKKQPRNGSGEGGEDGEDGAPS